MNNNCNEKLCQLKIFIDFIPGLSYSRNTVKTILTVGSGKGGVGKTIFVANLGVSLAKLGKTVILIDLDLGGSNLHTCLGVKNRFPGIGSLIYKKEPGVESLLVSTDIKQLFFVPGDSLFPGTANLNFFVKKKIIKEIGNLVADYIVIDLSGGSYFNTIDFFLITKSGMIITTPETTAILNSYSFLKSALYRLLYRSFPRGSAERRAIYEFISNRIEGSNSSFVDLIDIISEISVESREIFSQQLKSFFPRIVINRGHSKRDILLGSKLREISRKNLGIEMEYIGFIKEDPLVSGSIFQRKPAALLYPDSDFAKTMDGITRKLIQSPLPESQRLYEADEDLETMLQEENQG